MNAVGERWRMFSTTSLAARYTRSASAWLHPQEISYWRQSSNDARRASWCFGRIAAKCLLLTYPSFRLATPRDIEIRSLSERHQGLPPQVLLREVPMPLYLSISHSAWRVVAAVSTTSIGVDVVEDSDAQSPALSMWLLPEERTSNRVYPNTSRLGAYWAAKEAAFKTLPTGTPFQPHRIALRFVGPHRTLWQYTTNESSHSGAVTLHRGRGFTFAIAERDGATEPPSAMAL